MKNLRLLVILIAILFQFRSAGAETEKPDSKQKTPSIADKGLIEAKVVAVNRGFGFVVVDAGSKKGVKRGMKIFVLRGEKRFEGLLRIGEIEEKATVLEFVPGKTDPRDKFTKVIFLPAGDDEK